MIEVLSFKSTSSSDQGFSWDCVLKIAPWLNEKIAYFSFGIFGLKMPSVETPWFHLIFEVYFVLVVSLIYAIRWIFINGCKKPTQMEKASLMGTIIIILFNAYPNIQQFIFELFE